MFKRLFSKLQADILGYIVYKKNTNSWAIVWASDWSEILLTSCVPYLQFDCFVVERDHSRGELHSKSDLVIVVHALLHELGDYATFPNASVSHYDEFKQIIELGHY